MPLQLFPPLGIVVDKNGWHAILLTGLEYTKRERDLIGMIREKGGIDETVPRGHYIFNAIPGPTGEVLSLTPVSGSSREKRFLN